MDGYTESWWILSGGNGDAWGCFEDKMIVFPPLMHNFGKNCLLNLACHQPSPLQVFNTHQVHVCYGTQDLVDTLKPDID